MRRSQDPPAPDLSKTFWTPAFPEAHAYAVRRMHPILRWGDYNPTTGLYFWQRERFKGNVNSLYMEKSKRGLIGMWYGAENDPRCDSCEVADRCCTRVLTDTHGLVACARCRINPLNCSFTNGGRKTSSTMARQGSGNRDGEASEDSDDEPLAKRHKRSTTHHRDRKAKGTSDIQPPTKKYFGPSRRRIVHDDSDGEVSVKTIPNRRRINDGHDVNITEPQSTSFDPDDGVRAGDAKHEDLRRVVIEIPDSLPASPLFCTPSGTPPATKYGSRGSFCSHDGSNDMYGGFGGNVPQRSVTGNLTMAQVSTTGSQINAPKGPKAMRIPKDGTHGRVGYSGGDPLHTSSPGVNQGHLIEASSRMDSLPSIASVTDHVHIQERLTTLEVENDRYKAEKRQDRERVLELEEQINLLKEQQDRKLKQGLRELKKQMNYALNQSIMQQPGREDE